MRRNLFQRNPDLYPARLLATRPRLARTRLDHRGGFRVLVFESREVWKSEPLVDEPSQQDARQPEDGEFNVSPHLPSTSLIIWQTPPESGMSLSGLKPIARWPETLIGLLHRRWRGPRESCCSESPQYPQSPPR